VSSFRPRFAGAERSYSGAAFAPLALIAAHTRLGVAGMSMWSMPSGCAKFDEEHHFRPPRRRHRSGHLADQRNLIVNLIGLKVQ
jgi:hypothetical protein